MAGDWIKVEKSTARKPEVLRLSDLLGIHPDQAFGLCVRFWSWCDDHMTDGHAQSVTNVTLDTAFGHAGFSSALIEVGWLRVRSSAAEGSPGCSLEVPHFDRHLSESAKNRALSANRKQKQRGKIDGEAVSKMSRSQRDKSGTREEKTVQNRTEQNRAAVGKPKAEPEVEPMPLGKINPSAVFRALTEKHLASARSMVEWFRRQLSASSPVLEPTREDQLFTVCCAMRATEPGIEKPVGKFVKLVQGLRWSEVERYRQAAETAIAEVEASMRREAGGAVA